MKRVGGESEMTDPLFRILEQEVTHLRQLRATVLNIMLDERLSTDEKLRAIERAFEAEHDPDEDLEEVRDRERLS
jgi:hypothetical protein